MTGYLATLPDGRKRLAVVCNFCKADAEFVADTVEDVFEAKGRAGWIHVWREGRGGIDFCNQGCRDDANAARAKRRAA